MAQGLLVKARDENELSLTGFTRSQTPFRSSAIQAHWKETPRMTEAPYSFQHLSQLALTLNLGVLEYVPHSTSDCGGHCLKIFI